MAEHDEIYSMEMERFDNIEKLRHLTVMHDLSMVVELASAEEYYDDTKYKKYSNADKRKRIAAQHLEDDDDYMRGKEEMQLLKNAIAVAGFAIDAEKRAFVMQYGMV